MTAAAFRTGAREQDVNALIVELPRPLPSTEPMETPCDCNIKRYKPARKEWFKVDQCPKCLTKWVYLNPMGWRVC